MRVIHDIKKSKIDDRDYLGLELANKLRVVLVYDRECHISSANAVVGVGSFWDPIEFQGLAHFLEHMLFLGSEKYPEEGRYKRFVSSNGGASNASTSPDRTQFYYTIKSEKFLEAFDIFAQFFISPSLNEECMNREINAVDSEASKNMNKDPRKLYQLKRHISQPLSVYNKYSTGNLSTLDKPGLREALLHFHKAYYSSDVMAVAIYHNRPFAEYQDQVINILSQIPNKSKSPLLLPSTISPFPSDRTSKLIRLKPILNKHIMKLVYILEDQTDFLATRSLNYLSHIIGLEAAGTPAYNLIERGLCHSLTTSTQTVKHLFSTFEIYLVMTEKGLESMQAVLEVIGKFVRLCVTKGPSKAIFDEQQTINEIRFDYSKKLDAGNTAETLSSNLLNYPIEDVHYGPTRCSGYNESLIQKLTEKLSPSNLLMFVSSPLIPANSLPELEPIYGTSYSYQDLPEELASTLVPVRDLSLQGVAYPLLNRFIPRDLSILQLEAPCDHPLVVFDDGRSKLYHKFEAKYKEPKVDFWLQIYDNTLGHYGNQITEVYGIYTNLLDLLTRSEQYEFEQASASLSFNSNNKGVTMHIKCFSDTLQQAVACIPDYFMKMVTFDDESKWKDAVNKSMQTIENQLKGQPSTLISEVRSDVLCHSNKPLPKKLQALRNATWEEFKRFRSQIFRGHVRYKALIEGNIGAEKSTELFTNLIRHHEANFSPKGTLREEDIPVQRVAIVPTSLVPIVSRPNLVPSEQNSAILMYYQLGDELSRLAEYEFLLAFLKNKFFFELRTKQQLGYSVHTTLEQDRGVFGLSFVIQSNHKTPSYCQQRIAAFLDDAKTKLECISAEEFEEIQQGLLSKARKPFMNLFEQASDHIFLISQDREDFDRKKLKEQRIQELKRESVIDTFAKMVCPPTRQLLEIYLVAESMQEEQDRQLKERLAGEPMATPFDCPRKLLRRLELRAVRAAAKPSLD